MRVRRWRTRVTSLAVAGTVAAALTSGTAASAEVRGTQSAALPADLSCPDENTLPPTGDSAQDRATRARIAEAVDCLINRTRFYEGIPTVEKHFGLKRAAQDHADQSVQYKWWSNGDPHTNPVTGTTPEIRIRSAHYCSGTNLRFAEITYNGAGSASTAAAALNWWLNISTGAHGAIIGDPTFVDMGVGVAPGVADTTITPSGNMATYVVDFGRCG